MRWLCLLGLLLGSFALEAAPTPTLWQPDGQQLTALRSSVDGRYLRMFEHGHLRARMTSIDTIALALDAVASHYEAGRVTEMLEALLAMQDTNPASKTWGNIRWYQGDERIVDRNGIEFVTQRAALLWLLYSEQLAPAQRESLRRLLTLARTGITRHNVVVSYTNIALMKSWNLIALGEGLHDDVLALEGYRLLSEWWAHTQRTGVNEYLSPSYYPIDLECLALIHNLTRYDEARRLSGEGLDWLWQDVALNWYAPSSRLGGTHSRDYDRLFNHGGLDSQVMRAGWAGGGASGTRSRGPYDAYAWAAPTADTGSALQGPFPRIVSARWGDATEKRYLHYMDRQFDIASVDAGYSSGHDNAPLVINLGGGEEVPVINFFMDGRHDYYGQNKTLEVGSGHMKALHLRPFLTSVQRDNEVLFLASVRDTGADSVALESVLTLPADAEYWLDEHRLDIAAATSGWKFEPGPDGDMTRLDVQHAGDHEELVLADHDDARGVGVAQVFAVSPGQTYRLAASLQGGEVYLYLNFLDADKRLIGSEHAIRVEGGKGEFVWREQMLQAPEGAAWCKAWLYSTTSLRTDVRVADLRFEQAGTGAPLGQFDFHAYMPQQFEVPEGSTLFVRRQGAVAALRLLGAWNVEGDHIGFRLYNDGLAYRALRLTATHASVHTDRRGSLAMWATAAGGMTSDAAFATFRREVLARQGSVSLSGQLLDARMSPLRLRANVETGTRLLREGMTRVPTEAARWVGAPGH